MLRAVILLVSFAVLIALIWWRSWSCSVGEAMMGREMTHAEAFEAFFFNQWPEEEKGSE